jgi:hypothetical protein
LFNLADKLEVFKLPSDWKMPHMKRQRSQGSIPTRQLNEAFEKLGVSSLKLESSDLLQN